jgi:hypothetical protein
MILRIARRCPRLAPFLSSTGRGAVFLFGKTKRKIGGRIAQGMFCEHVVSVETTYTKISPGFCLFSCTAMKVLFPLAISPAGQYNLDLEKGF